MQKMNEIDHIQRPPNYIDVNHLLRGFDPFSYTVDEHLPLWTMRIFKNPILLKLNNGKPIENVAIAFGHQVLFKPENFPKLDAAIIDSLAYHLSCLLGWTDAPMDYDTTDYEKEYVMYPTSVNTKIFNKYGVQVIPFSSTSIHDRYVCPEAMVCISLDAITKTRFGGLTYTVMKTSVRELYERDTRDKENLPPSINPESLFAT